MKPRLLHIFTIASLLILSAARLALAQPGDVDLTFNASTATTHSVTLQPDGKMIVEHDVGTATLRLNPDGSADPMFASVAHGFDCAVVQADGNLLISLDGSLDPVLLRRIKANGTVDLGFVPQIGHSTNRATSVVRCLAIQGDGKILVGGQISTVGVATRNGLARLQPDGTLDASFNPSIDLGAQYSIAVRSLALQPDGRVAVVGDFTTIGGVARNHIARLNPDGSLDNAFDPGVIGSVASVALQPDGKLVIGGAFSSIGGTPVQASFARLNADGTMDASFVTPATVVAEDGSPILLQANGQMLVASASQRVIRLNADGSVDGNFSAILGGHCYSLSLQADGRVVVGGSIYTVNSVVCNGAARLENDLATQALSVPDAGRVRWERGGTSPEAQVVSFELSTDGGGTWTLLGFGSRITGGWELSGTSLPAAGTIRARARMATGYGNGSSSLLETVRPYALPAPPTVTTLEAVGLSDTSARLAATVNPNGSAGMMHFEYGADPALAGAISTADIPFGGGSANLPFSQRIGGLAPASRYYYRVVASTGQGASEGDIVPFTTDFAAGFRPVGDVDLTFNANAGTGGTFSAALQPDGKVVVEAGYWGGTNVRINSDGSADLGFSTTSTGFLGMAIQSDGRILVGTYPGGKTPLLRRLNADGTPDPSFNVPITSGPYGNELEVDCFAFQNDGKILIGGGFGFVAGVSRNNLARLLPDGTVDPDFNPTVGMIVGNPQSVRSIVVQPDGKIVITGEFTKVNGVTRNAIARLNPDGSLDSAFDPNIAGGDDEPVLSVALQPDGKLLIGGMFSSVGGIATPTSLARLNADGTLDGSFTPPNPSIGLAGSPIILQANGQILVSGGANHITRLNADGSVDWGFSAVSDTPCLSLGLQADGKVVIGGAFTTVNSVPRSRVARLNNDLATQALSVPDAGRVRWERGGTSPEAQAVSFEVSTDGGGTWTLLGSGSRITGGWELSGLSLPAAGTIRARARMATGYCNASSSLLETVQPFTLPAPPAVTTLNAMALSASSSQLAATVNPNGAAGTLHFAFSADPALAGAIVTPDIPFAAGTTDLSRSQTINGLVPASMYYYRAVATSANGTTLGAIVPFITAGQSGDIWLYQHFGAAWPGISFAADNDGDGVTNLAEYAFGGDPLAPDSAAILPKIDVSGGRLRITFIRDPAHNDIAMIVQGSNDLEAWTDLAESSNGNATEPLVGGVTVSESALGARRQVWVTDIVPIGAQPFRALRVKVSR